MRWAVVLNRREIFRYLVGKGADIAAPDFNELAALNYMYAAMYA